MKPLWRITPDELRLAHDLTLAWLSNPATQADAEGVAAFLSSMAAALNGLSEPAEPANEPVSYKPAVSVRASLAKPDVSLSMIDGRPYKTLTRHIRSHGLDPNSYRARYGLKPDYPMVAPGYREARRQTALRLGLGRKVEKAVEAVAMSKPVKKVRKSISEAKQAAKAHLGGQAVDS